MFISIIISDIITRLLHKFLNISKIILGMSFLLTSLLQRQDILRSKTSFMRCHK